jgi:lysozyme family protein
MKMNFDKAFQLVVGHEGGFVDHPDDPGGATNFGITEGVAAAHGYTGQMKDIPLSTAKYIYQVNYWDKIRGDLLPNSLKFHVFDAAVNSGVKQAIMWLQQCAGVNQDGVIGPKTIAASDSVSPAAYTAVRLRFLTNTKGWNVFGRGWARRIADNLEMTE